MHLILRDKPLSRSCFVLVAMATGRLKGTRKANLAIKFSETNEDDIGNIPGEL